MNLSDLQFQLMTFFLELCGLSLAYIEVRSPNTAAKIARYLGKLASPIEDLRSYPGNDDQADARLAQSLGTLLKTALTLGTLPLLFIYAYNLWEAFRTDSLTMAWLIPQAVGFMITLVMVTLALLLLCLMLYFTVVAGSDFATRFVEGRAVGTLGILLAGLGLMLELYQLITLAV